MTVHPPRNTPGDFDLERELRAAFEHGADGLPQTADAWTRTSTAVARARSRRRATWAVAGASVAVLVAGGLVGGQAGLLSDGHTAPAGTVKAPLPSPLDPAWKDLRTWPARGDLAADQAFVERGRKIATGYGAQLRRVLYAGTLGSGRLLTFLGDPVAGSDFQGVTGEFVGALWWRDAAEPDGVLALSAASLGQLRSLDRLAVEVGQDDGGVGLIVLVRPDAAVAVSARPDVDAAGTLSRRYTRLEPAGGVAQTILPPGPMSAVAVRTQVPGEQPVVGGPTLGGGSGSVVDIDQQLLHSASLDARCKGVFGDMDVDNAVRNAVDNWDGVDQPAAIVPLWCRRVGKGRVGSFVVRLQDGTTLRTTYQEWPMGQGETSMTGDAGYLLPWDHSERLPFAVPSFGEDLTYFVHAPGAASVRLMRHDAGSASTGQLVVRAVPDQDGFAKLTVTRADLSSGVWGEDARAQILLVDAAGRTVAQLSLADMRRGPDFGTSLDGPVH